MARKPPLDSLPVGRTMKAAHMAAQCIPNSQIVKARELVEASFARGTSPSASARKTLALMIQKAAGEAWKPGPHSILKRDLRSQHGSNDRLPAILDELQRTLLRIEGVAPDGRAALLVAPVIAYRIEHKTGEDDARVWWTFSDPARRAMQGSDHFAAMNRGALLAFESRYAVTLYERGCLLFRRRNHEAQRWHGTVEELREVMGVPAGKHRGWADVRVKVLEPAIAEVNMLAEFIVSSRARHGPHNKVLAVELWFLPKAPAGREAAAAELKTSRVGRKARRQSTMPKTPSPEGIKWVEVKTRATRRKTGKPKR